MAVGTRGALIVEEDRPRLSFPDVEVERPCCPWCERDGGGLVAFALDEHGPVTAVDFELVDVCAERFGDPKPVQRKQRRQRVIASARQSRLDEERTKLVAIQSERGRFVVLLWASHMCSGIAVDEPLLFAVPVEATDRGQASPDRRPCFAFLLGGAGVQFDVGTLDCERVGVERGKPSDPLAQIEPVRVEGGTGVAGQEPGERPIQLDRRRVDCRLAFGQGELAEQGVFVDGHGVCLLNGGEDTDIGTRDRRPYRQRPPRTLSCSWATRSFMCRSFAGVESVGR